MQGEYSKENFGYEIEKMIDKSSLNYILEVISAICFDKAEHVRSNWQDEPLAIDWEHDGNEIQKLTEKIIN